MKDISRHLRVSAAIVGILTLLLLAVACARSPQSASVGDLALREFPPELADDATPLAEDLVRGLYEGFFSNARMAPADASTTGKARAMTDYCANHRGIVVVDAKIAGATFEWTVEKRPEHRWNEVVLIVRMDDRGVPEKLGLERGQAIEFEWGPVEAENVAVFARLGCAA